jgi:thiol-disulfide isomerase/thioredoxin
VPPERVPPRQHPEASAAAAEDPDGKPLVIAARQIAEKRHPRRGAMRGTNRLEKSNTPGRVQHIAVRELLPVLLVLLAILMLPTACSKESANSGGSTPTPLDDALASGKPTLAGFVGDDCCQTITPTLEELAVDYGGTYNILIIEAGEQKDLFNQYDITLTPTQVYFDSTGAEVERIVGRISKADMVARLAGMGV